MNYRISFHPALAATLAFALGLPSAARAQGTATSGAGNAQESEVIELSPFEVDASKDVGYTAVDSLAGGRQNVPVRVTPASVSSLTKTFLNDLSLTNVQDALEWGLNAIPTNFRNGMNGGSAGDVFNYWSVSIRGDSHVQGGNPPTKNYFPTFMAIDTYNIDRIEIDGGPNSILFGIGDIGGSLTSYTKNAQLGAEIADVNMRLSSYGGYRFTADVNRSVTDNWAVRLNAVVADEKGWKDGDFRKKLGAHLATTYKLAENTQVRLEIEGWKEKKAIFASTIRDGVSLWNGTANAATWGQAVTGVNQNPLLVSGAPGVKTMEAWGGPANYLVWTPSVGLYNWAGGARSMGVSDVGPGSPFLRTDSYVYGPTGTEIPALPSKEFTITPTDATLKPEAITSTLSFEHQFNENSEFQIAGYYYEDKAHAINFEGAGGGLGFGVAIDLNQQLPDGQPNPNYGKRYSDFFLDEQQQNHRVYEVRGQYTYHFDTEVGRVPLNQSFSVSAGHQVTELGTRQHQAAVLNNFPNNWTGSNWTQSMVWGRVYWDEPQAALRVPKSYNGMNIDYIGLPFNWFDWDSRQAIDFVGAFSQSRLWNDRVSVTLGYRHDAYDNRKDDARGTNNTTASDSGNTYSAGVVAYVTPWLGVVGNMSENFQPAAGGQAPSLYGGIFGPSFGKGRSVGLRVSTLDHKYWASISYYNDKSTDVIGGDHPDFQGIWNQYFEAGGTNTDIGPAGNVTGDPGAYHANMQYNDTYDVKYTGYEFELTMNPTPNIRVQAHYAKPEGEKVNNGPDSARYFAEKLSIWQQAANGTSPQSTTLATTLTNAQNRIDAVSVPTITANLAKKIYNVFAAYTFLDGGLKGFEFGGGVTGLGKQYRNPWDTINGERILSPAYNTWTLFLGYSTQFSAMNREVRAKFQLNVDNLLDEDKLIFLGYQSYGNGQVAPLDYRYLNPREITFTATFSF